MFKEIRDNIKNFGRKQIMPQNQKQIPKPKNSVTKIKNSWMELID